MDLDIKPDPDMLDAEFLDEEQKIGNLSIFPDATRNQYNIGPGMIGNSYLYHPVTANPQAMYLSGAPTGIFPPNMNCNLQQNFNPLMQLPTPAFPPNYFQQQLRRINETVLTNSGQQQSVYPMTSSSLPCLPTRIPPQTVVSTETFPAQNFSSNKNTNLQQNVLPAIVSPTPLKSFPQTSPEIVPSDISESSEHSVHKRDKSNVLLHKLKQRVINRPEKEKISCNKKMSSHWKRKCLNTFETNGCSKSIIQRISGINCLDAEWITEFYGKKAKKAQDHVHEECDSLSFNNITQWLKYLNAVGISEQCNFEAAVVLNVIANNEFHPEPESLGDINLKSIYKFLSNALMGLPQPQLNGASAKFLSHEFQNLINEANTDEADKEVLEMKTNIEEGLFRTVNGRTCSKLDPLNTNTDDLRRCYEIVRN